jgi:hypothetical protein
MQVALAIKQAKASTSAIILPRTLIRMWASPQLSASKVVLGPLVPFTFWSQYEAVRSVGKWTGKADYNLLRHPEGVDNHRLEIEKVCMSIRRQMSNTLFMAAIPT